MGEYQFVSHQAVNSLTLKISMADEKIKKFVAPSIKGHDYLAAPAFSFLVCARQIEEYPKEFLPRSD
jgi:hypothetical protein